MPSTTLASLTEDEIDDLLYFARTGELQDLQTSLSVLAKTSNVHEREILTAAVDPNSGNGLLHMASANGHNGTPTNPNPTLITTELTRPPHAETLKFLLALHTSPSQSPFPTESNIINAQNSSGNTPLHWGSLNGHLEAVKVLVAAGADPAMVNKAGHDVVYEAEVNGKEEVVGWLLTEGKGLEKGLGVSGGVREGGEVDDVEEEGQEEGDEAQELEEGAEVQDLKDGVGKMEMAEKP